jgi:flavodoxin
MVEVTDTRKIAEEIANNIDCDGMPFETKPSPELIEMIESALIALDDGGDI